jgi:peptide/nickel transport system permease protein
MPAYLFSRFLQAGVVLFLMSFLSYILIGLMPGDPIDIMLAANPEATAEDAARLRAVYGLDQPLLSRYWQWLSDALTGDFGYSRLFSQPVGDLLLSRMGYSLVLMGLSLLLALIIALPAGIYAAYRKDSFADRFINLTCFAGISIPPFWLALLLISLFAVTLGWLPAGGYALDEDAGIWVALQFLALPVLTLSLATIAGYTRYIRSAMIESLQQDHIRTARAKGCSEIAVILRHGLRAALPPVVTVLSLDFGTLFGGALITETVFARPGMGKLIYDAILGNDYNLALLSLLTVTVMILIGNLLADLSYAWLDPRISLHKEGSK